MEQSTCNRGQCMMPSLERFHEYTTATSLVQDKQPISSSQRILVFPPSVPDVNNKLRGTRACDHFIVSSDITYCDFKGFQVLRAHAVGSKIHRSGRPLHIQLPPKNYSSTKREKEIGGFLFPAANWKEKGKGKRHNRRLFFPICDRYKRERQPPRRDRSLLPLVKIQRSLQRTSQGSSQLEREII